MSTCMYVLESWEADQITPPQRPQLRTGRLQPVIRVACQVQLYFFCMRFALGQCVRQTNF